MELNDNTVDIFSPYYKIDLCACYEPFFYPPKEQVEEWERLKAEVEMLEEWVENEEEMDDNMDSFLEEIELPEIEGTVVYQRPLKTQKTA